MGFPLGESWLTGLAGSFPQTELGQTVLSDPVPPTEWLLTSLSGLIRRRESGLAELEASGRPGRVKLAGWAERGAAPHGKLFLSVAIVYDSGMGETAHECQTFCSQSSQSSQSLSEWLNDASKRSRLLNTDY